MTANNALKFKFHLQLIRACITLLQYLRIILITGVLLMLMTNIIKLDL